MPKSKKQKEAEEQYARQAVETRRQIEERRKKYVEKIQSVGNPSKVVYACHGYVTSQAPFAVAVYPDVKKILIGENVYGLSDILSFAMDNNQKVLNGTATTETKSSTAGTIARGVVGGLVAGPAGAIIGGTTAGKKSTTTIRNGARIDRYTIHVSINSFETPSIDIKCGGDSEKAYQIIGILNVIMQNK